MTDPRSGKLRVTLYLRRHTGERPIVFKSDGKRFPQPFTIKLNQDEAYDLQLVLQPSFKVDVQLRERFSASWYRSVQHVNQYDNVSGTTDSLKEWNPFFKRPAEDLPPFVGVIGCERHVTVSEQGSPQKWNKKQQRYLSYDGDGMLVLASWSLLIHEEKVNLQKVKKATKHVADDEHSTTYTGEWKPQAFERTQRKARQQLKIAVILKDGGMLISTVQCKFYPVEEVSHSSWGESLTAIQFECHVHPTGGVLTINKQHFL